MKIAHVVGARPNFMKAAPVMAALGARSGVHQILIHTGQHYDRNMSDIFFRQLGLPAPDCNLEVGSGGHVWQTTQIMTRIEPVLCEQKPDLTLVYGDVNSTVAAALVCATLCLPIGHVEAGLRSGDRTMPEEINRLVTDKLCSPLLTPSADGDENLLREGVPPENIHRVGNVMIDTLVRLLPQAEAHRHVLPAAPGNYVLVTLHRPSNVDAPDRLLPILDTLEAIGADIPVLFPMHPRTRTRLEAAGASLNRRGIHFMEPVGYLEFLVLQKYAACVLTDSGGIQEETSYLGVPCLTMRENTERPVTVTLGTNRLVGHDMGLLRSELAAVLAGRGKKGGPIPLWDGQAGERIADVVLGGVSATRHANLG